MQEKGYVFLTKMQEKGCVFGQRVYYSTTIVTPHNRTRAAEIPYGAPHSDVNVVREDKVRAILEKRWIYMFSQSSVYC